MRTWKSPRMIYLDGQWLKSLDENRLVIGSKTGTFWVPARPVGGGGIRARFRAAWAVFTGDADAITWPAGQ